MYLDPGFGGMLIQIVVALVAAGGAIIFAMRKRIRDLFTKNKKPAENANLSKNVADDNNDVIDMISDDDK
jgi:hypothetical protein